MKTETRTISTATEMDIWDTVTRLHNSGEISEDMVRILAGTLRETIINAKMQNELE